MILHEIRPKLKLHLDEKKKKKKLLNDEIL